MDKTDWTELCADILEHAEAASQEYFLYDQPEITDDGFYFELKGNAENYTIGTVHIEGYDDVVEWLTTYEVDDGEWEDNLGDEETGTLPIDAPMSEWDALGPKWDQYLYDTAGSSASDFWFDLHDPTVRY